MGILLLAAATLLLELCLTRVLSVTLWYHFAFMVVSTALFGLGFAGVVLSLRKRAESITIRLLSLCALSTPIAFVVGYVLFHLVPFEPFSLGNQPVQWIYLPLSYLAVTMPFFCSGATVAALLTRYAASVHRLYWFDLMGAGLGSFAVAGLLPLLGAPVTVMAAAVLAAVSAALISLERGRAWFALGISMAGLLLVAGVWADDILPFRISSNKVAGKDKVPVSRLLSDPRFHLFTAWNTLSRVDVVEHRDSSGRAHRSILIDAGTAVTRMAHPEEPLDRLSPTRDEEGFFIRLYSKPRVLVVGSGGGREVLLALRNQASKIVAVEVNPAINRLVEELMADFTGYLYKHPSVQAYTDEARSFLRRSSERYHVIHCPHTISNAALSSGSLSLAENHLMTLEAFEDYLDHLTPEGVLVITRPEAHLPRLFVTVRKLFEGRSFKHLKTSLLAWRARSKGLSFYAGLALKKQPFSAQELMLFSQTLKERGLEPLYLPGSKLWDIYSDLLASDLKTIELPFASILEPATDDKPFFNQRVEFSKIGWSDLMSVFSQAHQGRMALEERPVAEAALMVLLAETLVVALLFMLLPLVVFRRRALEGLGRLRTLFAFAALGLAYIVVEVGFIQRLTLYLGRPVVVFSCVLGTLLVMSGIGSAWSQRFSGSKAPRAACCMAALLAALVAWGIPWVVDVSLSWPLWLRILTTVGVLAPVGFVMGMPYPLLIKRLYERYPERIPWAFGINGFASVAGSIGAVIIGMAAGYTAVLCVGVVCYAAAALVCGSNWLGRG